IVMDTSVAARVVALRDRAQQEPDAAATVLLSADECAVLVAKLGKGQAVLRLTRGQAVVWIGRLGGHLNRQRDGMPGVRTLRRGVCRRRADANQLGGTCGGPGPGGPGPAGGATARPGARASRRHPPQETGGIVWRALARMVTTRWWRAGEVSAPRARTRMRRG